jgi:hypothetical protein
MKPEIINQKLQFLYTELYKLEEIYSPQRKQYFLEEIDYYEAQLLKLKINQNLKEIENE